MYRKQHGQPQMNELHHLSTLFSWLGSRCLLGEGERADSCLLQPYTVIPLLAVILWEPVSCHHCVGLPVVSPPHSSARWSLAITCKSSAAFWGLCGVSDGLSKPVIAFHVGQLFSTLSFKSRVLVYLYLRWWSLWTSYFTPSVLPWRTKSVRMTEYSTGLETQLTVMSYGWHDSCNIFIYSGQLNAIRLKRRPWGEYIGVMDNLISVKWTNWEKSGLFSRSRYTWTFHTSPNGLFSPYFVAFDTEQGFEAIGYVKVLISEPNATLWRVLLQSPQTVTCQVFLATCHGLCFPDPCCLPALLALISSWLQAGHLHAALLQAFLSSQGSKLALPLSDRLQEGLCGKWRVVTGMLI